jgi:hypothetical protein
MRDDEDKPVLKYRVPLGGSVSVTGPATFWAWVPTRFAGTLVFEKTFAGTPPQTVEDKRATTTWGVQRLDMSVEGRGKSYTITCKFWQEASASIRPWNGGYWPLHRDVPPNLYSAAGEHTPLLKYDLVHGTATRPTEEAMHSGGHGTDGHCFGWMCASILVPEPLATQVDVDGEVVAFNRVEMKGLYSEAADIAKPKESWGWYLVGGPGGAKLPSAPCTAALDEAIDAVAGKFHLLLCEQLIKERKCLIADLRDAEGGDPGAVWNHAIFRFRAEFVEAPALVLQGHPDPPRPYTRCRIATTLSSNSDLEVDPAADAERTDKYVYELFFNPDSGNIAGFKPNWISCSGFPPACVGMLITDASSFPWHSKCGVEKGRLDRLVR